MLTPIDIQNHSLKTAVRGYSKKETDEFLEEILEGYEALYKENRELKDKITSLSEGIQYYKQMETTLQKALVLAEKTSTETQEAAKSKADALTSEAQTKADAVTSEAQTKADAVTSEAQTKADALIKEAQAEADALRKESQAEADALRKETQAYSDITKAKANRELEETRTHVRKLVQSYENYRLQFKKLAESQIEMLESKHYSIFAPELAEMLDGAPDADTVMDAEKLKAVNQKAEPEEGFEFISPDSLASEVAAMTADDTIENVETVENEAAAAAESDNTNMASPETEAVYQTGSDSQTAFDVTENGSEAAQEATDNFQREDSAAAQTAETLPEVQTVTAQTETEDFRWEDSVAAQTSSSEDAVETAAAQNIQETTDPFQWEDSAAQTAEASPEVEAVTAQTNTESLSENVSGAVETAGSTGTDSAETEQEALSSAVQTEEDGFPSQNVDAIMASIRQNIEDAHTLAEQKAAAEENTWENTVPKVEGYSSEDTKTVTPGAGDNDSPFTFIDTE